MLGIVVALREEALPIWRRLEGRRWARERGIAYGEGRLGGRPVLLARSGMGRAQAEQAAAALLARAPLSALCAAGFAGALSPQAQPGDLLWAETLLLVPDPDAPFVEARYARVQRAACSVQRYDHTTLHAARCTLHGGVAAHRSVAAHVGTLVTTDRVLVQAKRKRALAAYLTSIDRPPLGVDMESAGVAAAARSAGVGFVAIRAVTDGAHEDLPLDFGRCIDRRGGLRAGSLAAQLARRPGAIPQVMRLRRTSLAASVRLAEFLAQVAPRLP